MSQVTEKDVQRLFSENKFRKAFLGGEGFIWKDSVWGVHDTLSVFFCFFEWLEKQDNTFLPLQRVKEIISDIFLQYREVNKIDSGLTSLDIIKCYCIAAKEDKNWPIEPEFFINLITENIGQFSKEEIDALNIRRDVDLLRNYLPGLPPNEKLYN